MLTPRGTQRFMTEAWDFAFMPAPWESLTSLFWLPTRLFHFVGFMVGLIQPDTPWEAVFLGAYAALAILGVIYLFRHDRVTATLLFTPLVVAILASALRLMPLSGRLMIYVGPTFLVACLAGLKQVEPRLPRRLRQGVMFFLVAVPAVFLPLLLPTLTRHEDADRVLREVRERWRPGDVLYAYEGAVGAMRFYGEPLGLVPWIAGRNHGPDLRAYLRDVDTLRGHSRAWFFYTHGTGCEIALIRSYLESTGMETDRIDDPHGLRGMHEAAAILYDLARPDPGSSAATHPLFERPDPRCRRGGKSTGAGIWDRLRVFLAADAG